MTAIFFAVIVGAWIVIIIAFYHKLMDDKDEQINRLIQENEQWKKYLFKQLESK